MFYFWAQASLYVDVFWTCCLLDILLSCILFECAIVFRPQRSSSPALFPAGHASSTVETFPCSSIGWPVSCFLLEENAQAPCRGSKKDSQPLSGMLLSLSSKHKVSPSRRFNKHVGSDFGSSWEHRTKQKEADISLSILFFYMCSCSIFIYLRNAFYQKIYRAKLIWNF